jgi:hypothetical protein
VIGWFTRKVERLVARFWDWCEEVLAEPDERTDPPHVYATPGTIGSWKRGDRCLYCGRRDAAMRAHTEHPCERPYRPELA